ncbi:MAG: hypothetical protein ACKOVA_13975 [Novosphingobium sp.]
MVAKVLRPIPEVIDDYSGLSRRVLDWASVQKELMDASTQPGFDPDRWDVLADFVDADRFLRIGTVKEEMRFADFLGFMRQWAPSAQWDGYFKRINEYDNVVVLELEERVTANGHSNAVNTISVYEFDEAGKLFHLDVYMQNSPE